MDLDPEPHVSLINSTISAATLTFDMLCVNGRMMRFINLERRALILIKHCNMQAGNHSLQPEARNRNFKGVLLC